MSYDLFWHGDFEAFQYYEKKARLEEEKRLDDADYALWISGQYVKDALESVYHLFNALAGRSAQKRKYPKEPYRVTQKKKNLDPQAKNISLYERLKRRFPIKKKKKAGDPDGGKRAD